MFGQLCGEYIGREGTRETEGDENRDKIEMKRDQVAPRNELTYTRPARQAAPSLLCLPHLLRQAGKMSEINTKRNKNKTRFKKCFTWIEP